MATDLTLTDMETCYEVFQRELVQRILGRASTPYAPDAAKPRERGLPGLRSSSSEGGRGYDCFAICLRRVAQT
jgi:hypothetical protein